MKAKLMVETPFASQIEAPDPDDKNPILPVHPGVAAYLNNGEQSFLDDFREYFYIGGMVLGLLGSAIAMVVGHRNRGRRTRTADPPSSTYCSAFFTRSRYPKASAATPEL
jgi:hypothetical protein